MDSRAKLYIKRAFTETQEAEVLFKISSDITKKREFQLEDDTTFYSGNDAGLVGKWSREEILLILLDKEITGRSQED